MVPVVKFLLLRMLLHSAGDFLEGRG